MNKELFAIIYGVPCKDITVYGYDKYGAYIKYRVKRGRKVHKCWIDLTTLRYLKSEGLIKS